MKMQEGETIIQYCARIKDVGNAIRESNGIIEGEIVINKVLRTLLPIYAIRVSVIQELRCIPGSDLTLEGLVGRPTTFELSNFDNFKSENVESTFKDKMTLDGPKGKKKKKVKHVSIDSDTDDEELEELKALHARKFHRGKGKYKGKLPIIFFNCNEVGHIISRCLEKRNNRNEYKYRSRRDERNKDYKDKGKKSCYIFEEDSSEELDDHDDKVLYVAMKDESDEDEATALVSYVSKGDRWIIDSGCLHHMTRDKSKFQNLENYNGNSVRLGNDAPYLIKGK